MRTVHLHAHVYMYSLYMYIVHEYVQCRSCAGHVTYILSWRRDGRRLWGHSEE